jgi:hypothetical protein
MRWRLWTRIKLALRKRTSLNPELPFELDEFAALLSSRDPVALKQLAAALAGTPTSDLPKCRPDECGARQSVSALSP